jgi:hypothetical protein
VNLLVDSSQNVCYYTHTLEQTEHTMELTLDTKAAGQYARGAAINAEMRNREMRSTWTSEKRSAAQTVLDLLDMAYKGNFYINYRKKFIAVKVDAPIVRDRLTVKAVKAVFKDNAYDVVNTPQGLVVRIMR